MTQADDTQPELPLRVWNDQRFVRAARLAVWGTLLVYPLGAVVMSTIYGSGEAGMVWIFAYWENLYWLLWTWLGPTLLLLVLLRRWRAAMGVVVGGVLVTGIHAAVLSYVVWRGVRW